MFDKNNCYVGFTQAQGSQRKSSKLSRLKPLRSLRLCVKNLKKFAHTSKLMIK